MLERIEELWVVCGLYTEIWSYAIGWCVAPYFFIISLLCFIVSQSITKFFQIVIGSLHAYFSHKQHAIMWVSN